MALHLVSSETIRTSCRQRIETCELWLRRHIHEKLRSEFGDEYVFTARLHDAHIFSNEIQRFAKKRLDSMPRRYARPIDALELDTLSSVISKADVYKKYFRESFQPSFVNDTHLRLTLKRLVPVRNALSHAHPISLHEAERTLCYCSDIIKSLVDYYASVGMAQEFDAPSFTRFSDSLGNQRHLTPKINRLNFVDQPALHVGDSLRLEVEVDAHYPLSECAAQWQVANCGESGSGLAFALTLEPRHVNTEFTVMVTVNSNKEWHRFGNYDAILFVHYKVLPPPNSES